MLWKVAIYTRISEQEKDSEHNSIVRQVELLSSLASQKGLSINKEYTDNGVSGGSFDRPAFNEMIDDIQAGRINCVMVKDLSRFGREHIDANYFIEKFFPRFGVRIITAIEGFDSFGDNARMSGIEVPLINLFNDAYLQEVSKATRASLKAKMREGQFVGTLEPYAYVRSEGDKHRLVIDPTVADNVRLIYKWYLEGVAISGIAQRLNMMKIKNPTAWRAKLHQKTAKSSLWQRQQIVVILSNEVYVGDMVQGKTTSPNRKVGIRINVPYKQWISVQSTHEPIISRKDFEIVQNMLKIHTKSQNTQISADHVSVFAGLLFCDECGKAMKRHIKASVPPPQNMRYFCSTYLKLGSTQCTSHYILEKEIDCAVKYQINTMLDDLQKAVSSTKNCDGRRKLLESMGFRASQLAQEVEKIRLLKNELYLDLKRNVISEDEFLNLKNMFDEKIIVAEREQGDIEKERLRIRDGKNIDPVIRDILKYVGFQKLSRAMLVDLVEKSIVCRDRTVKVYYKNMDAIKKYL